MKSFFQKSKQSNMRISQNDLIAIASDMSPIASVRANRPEYCLVDEDDLRQWLFATQIDRNIWREAGIGKGEFVCVDFSLLLWALIEQERVRQQIPKPFAFARIGTLAHSFNGAVNEARIGKLIEPQTDAIALPDYVNPTIQTIDFV